MDESFETYPASQVPSRRLWVANWLTRFKPYSEQPALTPHAPAASRQAARTRIDVDDGDSAHLLRAQLSLRWFNAPNRRMLAIVSTDPRKDADALCCRLAVASAHAGRKTLLIDANLREPATADWMTAERSSGGLGALLASKASPSESVVPSDTPGLWLLAAGSSSRAPSNYSRTAKPGRCWTQPPMDSTRSLSSHRKSAPLPTRSS